MISESKLAEWGMPPRKDNEKCQYTYDLVRRRIEQELLDNKFDIFLQGSYANSTNIKDDSDVDIVVCNKSYFYPNYSLIKDYSLRNNIINLYGTGGGAFFDFKAKVVRALSGEFGDSIERKNKCIRLDIENSRMVDADIVPCYELKKFTDGLNRIEGVAFYADDGTYVESFPKEHKKNGEQKNKDTLGLYKVMVRIIKNCKSYYIEKYDDDSGLISSFMIEAALWNIPVTTYLYKGLNFKSTCNWILNELIRRLSNFSYYNSFLEPSKQKYLFDGNENKYTALETKTFFIRMYNLING